MRHVRRPNTDTFHRVWTAPFIAMAIADGWWQAHIEELIAAQRAERDAFDDYLAAGEYYRPLPKRKHRW